MKKALIIGINYYEDKDVSSLYGCVNDAHRVQVALERNGDGTKNFDALIETATDDFSKITRKELKELVIQLFEDKTEVALFYFFRTWVYRKHWRIFNNI